MCIVGDYKIQIRPETHSRWDPSVTRFSGFLLCGLIIFYYYLLHFSKNEILLSYNCCFLTQRPLPFRLRPQSSCNLPFSVSVRAGTGLALFFL